MNREPVAIVASIVAVVQAVPLGLVIFGLVDWDAEQLAYLEGLVLLVAAIPGAYFARSRVSPVNATPGE